MYSVLNQKRGLVFEEAQRPGTPIFNLKVCLLTHSERPPFHVSRQACAQGLLRSS